MSSHCHNLFLLKFLLLIIVTPYLASSSIDSHTSPHPDGVQCHLPTMIQGVTPTLPSGDTPPKFIEFSCSPKDGRYNSCTKLGGIGNTLIMFPAVYLASMLSGRELIIHDNSGLGNWCRALKCGFSFTSDIEKKYPELKKITHINAKSQNDFAYKLRMNISIPDEIVGFRGMDVYASKWIHYAGTFAATCVKHITGCDHRLIGCIERFAFQQLFPGGLFHDAMPSVVPGLSQQVLNGLVKNPYHESPRFDAGIHIRAQTAHLENRKWTKKSNYTEQMSDYLVTFQQFETALSQYFFVKKPVKFNLTNSTLTGLWPRVFISCDDVSVRKAFITFLLNRTSDIGQYLPVYVNTTDIKHTKDFDHRNTSCASQNTIDTAFEWYSLSLSRVLFAWRGGYSGMASTFMQSASRVSMMKPTKLDFKATILQKNGKWLPPFEYVDDVNELEVQPSKKKKHRGTTIAKNSDKKGR